MLLAEAADYLIQTLEGDLRMATPLGLGKPNQLINEIYSRALQDPSIRLKIYTALSLQIPTSKEELGKRFLGPFVERHWGTNYPELQYFKDAVAGTIPENVQVHEFYFMAGGALRSSHLQRHYQSVNYTHVAANLLRAEINCLVQLVAERNGRYSLSCNPDVTLDLCDLYRASGKKLLVVGVVHPDLPFMEGDAEVRPHFFDRVVKSSEVKHELYALPRRPIFKQDHLIGFYAGQLVRDGGTIQIGIGSLSDAIANSLIIRHTRREDYKRIISQLQPVIGAHHDAFEQGLYGLTEMLSDGFMHLRKAGLLKREVDDHTYLHGAFFLGSRPFYEWLRTLSGEDARGLRMTRVSRVNDLYAPNEPQLRSQRLHARFFNTTMQVTLLGEAMSETLDDGRVISGVGGQYNFVAMAQELKDSRSVIMLRSWRIGHYGKRVSNITWEPHHVTIPRHLRDVIVTEYGVADVRGKTDEECIEAILEICDSEFQEELLARAKRAGKIRPGHKIKQRNNLPSELPQIAFDPYPFGSDFTPEEEQIALALSAMSEDKKISSLKLLEKAVRRRHGTVDPAVLSRMDLRTPAGAKEKLYASILGAYLPNTD